MKVSLEWLCDYVDTKDLPPAELAERLTNSGLEVEVITLAGVAFSGVTVGKILTVEKHPNADRLRLVTVQTGNHTETVVCGAPNVREGLLIAYASVGAQVLNRQDGTTYTLEKAKIRGVESCGMICSLEELGLGNIYIQEEDGIWHLNSLLDDTTIGQPLEKALGLHADTLLDTAPTANRGDHMCLIGVAREVAALYHRKLTLPETPTRDTQPTCEGIQVTLTDPALCGYYGGAIMSGLQIAPSPLWLTQRLEAAGIRPINNVVDVTNYVMLEMGQPLHAFDLDKLSQGKPGSINVRQAKAGETFTTLDDQERTLTPETVCITWNDKPVALGGVMGGQNTEIDTTSKRLFLEAAYFPPASNRRSAKSVGLRTESSARFERGVDRQSCQKALFRAIQLYEDLAQAQCVGLVESTTTPLKETAPQAITLRYNRIEKILGIALDPKEVVATLETLGFQVKQGSGDAPWEVLVPSYRQHDVTREIDLIEEICRIQGYEAVPYTLPAKTQVVEPSPRQEILARIHHTLSGSGLQEVVTNSLIGDALLKKTGFTLDPQTTVSVTNAQSQDHTVMRQSVLPNLLEIAKYNLSQGTENIALYEVGRVYHRRGQASEKADAVKDGVVKDSGVTEKRTIAALVTGTTSEGHWHIAPQNQLWDFYGIKGIAEQLLLTLGISPEHCFLPMAEVGQPVAYLHPGQGAALILPGSKNPVGWLGQLHPHWTQRLKYRHPVYVFELDLETLYKFLKQQTKASGQTEQLLSPYPTVHRDMAFSVSSDITHRQILQAIEALKDPLITHVTLFDEYRGNQLDQNTRSLAYRLTLQSQQETLTDEVVESSMARVKKALLTELSVMFR